MGGPNCTSHNGGVGGVCVEVTFDQLLLMPLPQRGCAFRPFLSSVFLRAVMKRCPLISGDARFSRVKLIFSFP